jgi:hypothetical protein
MSFPGGGGDEHSAQTREVTILMPVADSAVADHATTFEDGAAVTDDRPEYPPGLGRAPVDAVVSEPADHDAGDAPGVTALALDDHLAEEALPGNHDAAATEEMIRVVDFGWGIVLPEPSDFQYFKEILSLPQL